MTAEPLALPADLAEFPGAPFSADAVAAASEAIRREVGWHIAPRVIETLTLDGTGGGVLFLPTLHLVDVTEVRDVTDDTPRVLTGWRKSQRGMLSRARGWPRGFEAIEVDVVHGYDSCPPELLPVIAERTSRRVMQESLGSRSVSYSAEGDAPLAATLARFKIPSRP